MTATTTDAQPQPAPPHVQAAQAAQALRALEVLALERAAVRAATGPLRAQLVAVQRTAMRAWMAAFGSLEHPGNPVKASAVAATVRGAIGAITATPGATLAGYADRAVTLGVGQAARHTGTRLSASALGATVDDATARIVAGVDLAIATVLADAEAAAAKAGSYADLGAALDTARRALPTAATAATAAVNGGANAGKRAAADALGAQTLWLAEPDACTTCLGMAGRLADPGQPFDPALAATFTVKPRIWPPGPIQSPPLHPHCRCEAVPWLGSAGAAMPLPEALQREARRSVYKGWSLPSESGAERIRAARILLARNSAAPKTVKAYARRAVAAGRFPTRAVPRYTPRSKSKP